MQKARGFSLKIGVISLSICCILLFLALISRILSFDKHAQTLQVQVPSPLKPIITSVANFPCPTSFADQTAPVCPFNAQGTPLTATPAPWEKIVEPTFPPPNTPRPLGQIVDLTDGTPVLAEELEILIVERANGTYDQYSVPPWLHQWKASTALESRLKLQAGDRYLYQNPVEHKPISETQLPEYLLSVEVITPTPVE